MNRAESASGLIWPTLLHAPYLCLSPVFLFGGDKTMKTRLLNEAIILSKKINAVSALAEVLYIRLVIVADDYGRYYADPEIVKAKVLTLRRGVSAHLVRKILLELWRARLIDLYQIEEEVYLEIKRFEDWQKFRADVKRRKDFPEPTGYTSRDVPDPLRPVTGTNGCVTKRNGTLRTTEKERERDRERGKEGEKKDKDIPEIIGYLNEKTGKKFSPSARQTVEFIQGRLAEGRTLSDFKHVIDVKVAKWKGKSWTDSRTGKPVMGDDYLRPETLFRPGHFESYLNEIMPPPKKSLADVIKEHESKDEGKNE
jgi:uncharacterized phage protein (TIGR02220 family)